MGVLMEERVVYLFRFYRRGLLNGKLCFIYFVDGNGNILVKFV